MKKTLLVFGIVLLGTCVSALAAENVETNATAADAEAKYVQAIEVRTANILQVLGMTDRVAEARVHDVIVAQYRSLRDWHDANDNNLKAAKGDTNRTAQVQASLRVIHNEFLSRLAADLTPAQVEAVKDKMTYGKVKVTYDAYCEIIPTLTDVQKARILAWLKDAREEAMDAGSADEKSAIFKIYKGRIANYLSKEGVDERKARQEWGAKQKEKAAAAP
jgi:hypothetical protein